MTDPKDQEEPIIPQDEVIGDGIQKLSLDPDDGDDEEEEGTTDD